MISAHAVHFDDESFFEGMDKKVDRLLKHIMVRGVANTSHYCHTGNSFHSIQVVILSVALLLPQECMDEHDKDEVIVDIPWDPPRADDRSMDIARRRRHRKPKEGGVENVEAEAKQEEGAKLSVRAADGKDEKDDHGAIGGSQQQHQNAKAIDGQWDRSEKQRLKWN